MFRLFMPILTVAQATAGLRRYITALKAAAQAHAQRGSDLNRVADRMRARADQHASQAHDATRVAAKLQELLS